MTKKSNVLSCIICDIARKEITGKDILVGVYAGTLGVDKFPATVPTFGMWIEYLPKHSGVISINVEVVDPQDKSIFGAVGELQVTEPGISTGLSVQFGSFTVEKPGKYMIRITAEDEAPYTRTFEFLSHNSGSKTTG